MTNHYAIIGSAGRNPPRPMTRELWDKAVLDMAARVDPEAFYYSGGAAWFDHLSVELFLQGIIKNLSLWLPAPLSAQGIFQGPSKSAASAANYYHHLFSQIIGVDTRKQILEAQLEGAWLNFEPEAPGYGAFFARNNKVAEKAVNGCFAYTWSEDSEPTDGGTLYTWNRCAGDRVHIPIGSLL